MMQAQSATTVNNGLQMPYIFLNCSIENDHVIKVTPNKGQVREHLVHLYETRHVHS